MEERTYITRCGPIHYWISKTDDVDKSDNPDAARPALVFLPGLTADHSLFEKQTEYFEGRVNVFVWDAPGHASSWPFELTFDLMDKARWLDEILTLEDIKVPVIVGRDILSAQSYNFFEKNMTFLALCRVVLPVYRLSYQGKEANRGSKENRNVFKRAA